MAGIPPVAVTQPVMVTPIPIEEAQLQQPPQPVLEEPVVVEANHSENNFADIPVQPEAEMQDVNPEPGICYLKIKTIEISIFMFVYLQFLQMNLRPTRLF